MGTFPLFAGALLAAVVPLSASAAAQPIAPAQLGIASSPQVGAFYSSRRMAPIWFRGSSAGAPAQLVAALKRASFDGFAQGPQLAAHAEAAIGRAMSGRPADVMAADQLLSSAWVAYVQALKRPTPGMYYAAPALRSPNVRADQILLTAAAAPSLAGHVQTVSHVNSIYAQLRDAAWLQAQASGSLTPDPRLLANLDRARSIPNSGRFVVVDIAGQRLTMFDNGQPVDSMKVIVGTDEFPTPMIASYIHYITLNPYWDSPDHLVRRNIAPGVLKEGFGYMKAKGYEVMADWSPTAAVIPNDQVDWKAVAAGKKQIRIRQKPGPANFMAKMKIPFQNDDDIYLHDTPGKALFAKSQRALSNGCVRLEDAARFSRWLLNGQDAATTSTEPEQHLQLARGVPIYLTYLTAQPQNGSVTYIADIYGWDRPGAQLAASGSLRPAN